MGAMEAAMHIDIYSILLFQLSTLLVVYQMAIPINKVSDAIVRNELKKLRSDYDGAIGLGDIIVWPIIMTIVFPLYILFRLIFKRIFLRLFKVIISDRNLTISFILIFTIFTMTVIFALLHWFIAYAILFVPSAAHLILNYKNVKSQYES